MNESGPCSLAKEFVFWASVAIIFWGDADVFPLFHETTAHKREFLTPHLGLGSFPPQGTYLLLCPDQETFLNQNWWVAFQLCLLIPHVMWHFATPHMIWHFATLFMLVIALTWAHVRERRRCSFTQGTWVCQKMHVEKQGYSHHVCTRNREHAHLCWDMFQGAAKVMWSWHGHLQMSLPGWRGVSSTRMYQCQNLWAQATTSCNNT